MTNRQYIDTAFKEEIQHLNEYAYHPTSNSKGIDNLPHAIKLLSLSTRGQRYKNAHGLQTQDVQYIIADKLGVSKDELHATMDNVGTIDSHIYHLDIPSRTFNVLTYKGFHTIKSMLNLTYTQALNIRGISEDYIQEFIHALKAWAKEAKVDIEHFPLIETMADPDLWTIGPNEIRQYLDYSFDHILNHSETLSIDKLDITQNVRKALKKSNIRTLDVLARKPIQQWINIKGLGRKTVMTLVLQMIEMDERIAQSTTYTATVAIQMQLDVEGISQEEAYEKTIEQLHELLDNKRIDINISES